MKLLLVLATTLISFASYGMELSCVTEFPTTSVVGEMDKKEFVVHVIHHNGMKYMPIQTGMITPSDLAALAQKTEEFAKLGDYYIFRWDGSKCKTIDRDIMNCSDGKETVINGTKVNPWSISTKRIHSEFDGAQFDQIEVSFGIEISGKMQYFSVQYSKDECAQAAKAQKILGDIK
jgi:hypothetical protein